MNQADMVNAASQAAQTSKNLVSRQVDARSTTWGTTLSQTARDLERIGDDLRSSGTISSAAQVADWAAGYVDRAASYLVNGNTELFLSDLESLARERPWAIAASAAALGFAAARVVKSSGARRYAVARYDSQIGSGNAVDASFGNRPPVAS